MTALFLDRATSEVVGMVSEHGAAAIAEGSFAHTFSRDLRVRFRAEVHEHGREPVLVLFETELDESGAAVGEEAPSDVLRFDERDGRVASVRWYYFCPETLTEVGLDPDTRWRVDELYVSYFFRRQEEFWEACGLEKLPAMRQASPMLLCGPSQRNSPRALISPSPTPRSASPGGRSIGRS